MKVFMNYDVVKECTLLSDQEKISFPEVVARLDEANIEMYYADLLVPSKTYYSKNEAYVVPCTCNSEKIVGSMFNQDLVMDAIRLIQSGKIKYQEFIHKIMEAGVVSYSVFITGRKAIYFGKKGEQQVEQFPNKS
jgi:uncharacterized protein YbcV (DUF1398 family)